MHHFEIKKGSKMGQKWHFWKLIGNPLATFWDRFGTILRHFSRYQSQPIAQITMEMDHFVIKKGLKMGQKWHLSHWIGNPVVVIWDHFGTILRHFRACLGPPTAQITMQLDHSGILGSWFQIFPAIVTLEVAGPTGLGQALRSHHQLGPITNPG